MPTPEQLSIETPEQIALEYSLAGVGSRFLALALDSLLQVLAGLLLIAAALFAPFVGLSSGWTGSPTWILAGVLLAGFVVYYGYFAAFEIVWQGQTPGKRAVGLRVIDETGRPMTAYQVLLRNLLRIVDQLPGLYAVGIAAVLTTRRHQRLGDLAAGTIVVRDRDQDWTPAHSMPEAPRLRLGISRLTDPEFALVERFLERRHDLEPAVRSQAAAAIVARLRDRVTAPPGTSDEGLLEEIAANYRSGGTLR